MKVVVFGPRKRTGALLEGSVVDLSQAYAKYLRERKVELADLLGLTSVHMNRIRGDRKGATIAAARKECLRWWIVKFAYLGLMGRSIKKQRNQLIFMGSQSA